MPTAAPPIPAGAKKRWNKNALSNIGNSIINAKG